jgi:hypothetical protein
MNTDLSEMTKPKVALISFKNWLAASLAWCTHSAWVAYGTLFLLQLKVMWGIWAHRGLTLGDTPSYFVNAYHWYDSYRVDIAWSPLYTAFYGSFLHITNDAVFATIAHRLVIALIASLLVLALMRRLLPHSIAWLIGLWWVVLPINFDTMVEVHLLRSFRL